MKYWHFACKLRERGSNSTVIMETVPLLSSISTLSVMESKIELSDGVGGFIAPATNRVEQIKS